MRTTIDINEKLLKEAWEIIHPSSKRDLIETSLREVIRREKLKRLANRFGRTPMITPAELLRLRRRG